MGTEIILDTCPGGHVTIAVHDSHWLPVTARIKQNSVMNVDSQKAVAGHVPKYITNLLTPDAEI